MKEYQSAERAGAIIEEGNVCDRSVSSTESLKRKIHGEKGADCREKCVDYLLTGETEITCSVEG